MALPRVPTQNNTQYTLDAQIAAGASSLTLNQSVAGIVRAPGVLVIDRIDSSGTKTPTKREYKRFTGVSGAQLTGLSGGLAGSTDQVHAVGAIVEFVPDVLQEQDWYDWATFEHTTDGVHASLPSLTVARTKELAVASLATIQRADITNLFATNVINASGASLQALPIVPVWVFSGTVSGATTNLGIPLDMPNPGTIQWISAITRAGSSNSSLFLEITKNGAALLGGNASQSVLMIPLNGTFASTASISSPRFNAGDVFNFTVLKAGSMAQDLTVKFYAR